MKTCVMSFVYDEKQRESLLGKNQNKKNSQFWRIFSKWLTVRCEKRLGFHGPLNAGRVSQGFSVCYSFKAKVVAAKAVFL